MNLTGMAESFIKNISVTADVNDPQFKVTPVGFLRSLLENPVTFKISNLKQIQDGHEHSLKLRWMKRGIESEVTDRDDCDMPLSPIWGETTINRPFFSKIGLKIPDADMRLWDTASSQNITAGSPASRMLQGLYYATIVRVNGLIQKINSNLLLAQAAKWGINAVTGNNAPQTITFSNTPTMTDGVVKLLQDYSFNELDGTPVIVGNGAVTAYNLLQFFKSSTDIGGFGAISTFRTYNDVKSTSVWGPNHFGVFAPGTVGFVDFNQYVGGFQNDTGDSVQFLLPVPVILANGELSALTLDAQLKYSDCNEFDDEGNIIVKKGWGLILSKSYGLFNAPDDMYQETDRLAGVNGSLHYVGTTQDGTIVAPANGSVWANA